MIWMFLDDLDTSWHQEIQTPQSIQQRDPRFAHSDSAECTEIHRRHREIQCLLPPKRARPIAATVQEEQDDMELRQARGPRCSTVCPRSVRCRVPVSCGVSSDFIEQSLRGLRGFADQISHRAPSS